MTDSVQDLGNGLVLRDICDARDVAQFVTLHEQVVSVEEGRTCEHLILRHPETGNDDFMVVEDTRTGQIIATICLIPWNCRFEGLPLRAAMLEMVVTHPDYRRRGLVRSLIERFQRITAERGFDVCLIEGIPYYYRQFGYSYAVDHRSYDALAASSIPIQLGESAERFGFRRASLNDVPALVDLYRDAMAPVAFHVERDAAYWRFLLESVRFPVQMMVDQETGEAIGYVTTLPSGKPGPLAVVESVVNGHAASMAALRRLRSATDGVIHLAWPQTGALIQTARSLGSVPRPTYQWLFRLTDVPAFLRKIGPVLERRLAASDCAGWTGDLSINLFRDAFTLRFDAGRLAFVNPIGFVDSSMGADGGDLCIPPDAFVRLALGYRGLDALWDGWPDIVVRPGSRHLLDILFPEITSYLCMPYNYLGPI